MKEKPLSNKVLLPKWYSSVLSGIHPLHHIETEKHKTPHSHTSQKSQIHRCLSQMEVWQNPSGKEQQIEKKVISWFLT